MPGSCRLPLHLPALLFLTGLLAACAVQPPVPEGERDRAWRQHHERIAELTQWRFKGRIGLRLEQQGWTASLHWRQQQADYLIRLIAPLGKGVYDLRGNGESVQLRLPDERLLYARDPQTLLQENLGWQVPVRGLIWWVRGVPSPDSEPESMSLDQRGRLQELQQDGWRVHYDRYGLFGGGVSLPEKLTIERDNLRLRLLIHTWEV